MIEKKNFDRTKTSSLVFMQIECRNKMSTNMHYEKVFSVFTDYLSERPFYELRMICRLRKSSYKKNRSGHVFLEN